MCGCAHAAPDWTHAASVTPSDGVNNVANALYLHNSGSAGDVPILFKNGDQATLYFRQGETIRGGYWVRVLSTGLGAGVEIVAFY
jgi:hypothetical protein